MSSLSIYPVHPTLAMTVLSYEDDVGSVSSDPTEPLLPPKVKTTSKKVTPLPKLQIGIVLLFQLAEPISSQSIYPFINQVGSSSHFYTTTDDPFIAGQRTRHHWRRRKESRVLRWTNRESPPLHRPITILISGISRSHFSLPLKLSLCSNGADYPIALEGSPFSS